MVSVIIAAHNEEVVLGTTLDTLIEGSAVDPLEVIVVVNGSTDGSARVARARAGVKVLELEQGSKPLALNAGEAIATSFPRVYLDADILVPAGGLDAVIRSLDRGALAAVPGRRLDTEGRPWLVRAYFAINGRLPVFDEGLFGRGMIALSAEGRSRFGEFPLLVADDLFLDSLYSPQEKAHVTQVEVVVSTPRATRDLLNRLVRVRRGNAAMRQASSVGSVAADVRRSDRWAWLRVVMRKPTLLPASIAYAAITLAAAVRARKGPVAAMAWGRGSSDRR